MKESQLLKVVVVIGLIVAGLGIATARAQNAPAAPAANNTASGDSTHGPDSRNDPSPVVMRGGYNIGSAVVGSVPGCIGSKSFCNLYFGH